MSIYQPRYHQCFIPVGCKGLFTFITYQNIRPLRVFNQINSKTMQTIFIHGSYVTCLLVIGEVSLGFVIVLSIVPVWGFFITLLPVFPCLTLFLMSRYYIYSVLSSKENVLKIVTWNFLVYKAFEKFVVLHRGVYQPVICI